MDARQMYNKWLNDFAADEALVKELQGIAGDEKEIEDRFYRGLEFGTAGMRGVIGYGTNRMNVYNVRRATQGLAQFIHKVEGGAERGVAIAYDSRRFSPEFALEAAKVLCANGVRVFLYESLRPVPVLSFTLRHLGCIAGIVITASHNPKQYNGYKVYWQDGGQLPPDRAAQVLECINALDYTDAKVMCPEEAKKAGLLTMIGKEVDDVYISRVRSLCVQPELCREMGKTMKIVYSPLNGSGNVPVRRILSEVGFENVYIVPEQELPDPNFTTVGAAPNPENYSAFDLARELAVKVDADVIFATDPDCDRLG
ncbi:MAG: phospho-sugar mutase, partial [Candidatus Spyradocola sp.]